MRASAVECWYGIWMVSVCPTELIVVNYIQQYLLLHYTANTTRRLDCCAYWYCTVCTGSVCISAQRGTKQVKVRVIICREFGQTTSSLPDSSIVDLQQSFHLKRLIFSNLLCGLFNSKSAANFKIQSSPNDLELQAPLLRSNNEEHTSSQGLHPQEENSTHRMDGSSSTDQINEDNHSMNFMWMTPSLRRVILRFLNVPSAADSLPPFLSLIATNGKLAVLGLLLFYCLFVSLWFPFWLLSFVVTEWGVYALFVGTVFLIGRMIVR